MSAKSEAYDRLVPGTSIGERQKEERFDRRLVKAKRAEGHPMAIQTPGDFDGFPDSPKTCEWVEIAPGKFRRVALPKEG